MEDYEYQLGFKYDESKDGYYLKFPKGIDGSRIPKHIESNFEDKVRLEYSLIKVSEKSKRVEKTAVKIVTIADRSIKLEDISEDNIYELIGGK